MGIRGSGIIVLSVTGEPLSCQSYYQGNNNADEGADVKQVYPQGKFPGGDQMFGRRFCYTCISAAGRSGIAAGRAAAGKAAFFAGISTGGAAN